MFKYEFVANLPVSLSAKKNFENRLTFGEVMVRVQCLVFLTHGIVVVVAAAAAAVVVYKVGLANLEDKESARDNHILAFNVAKYSPVFTKCSPADSTINLSHNLVINNPTTR